MPKRLSAETIQRADTHLALGNKFLMSPRDFEVRPFFVPRIPPEAHASRSPGSACALLQRGLDRQGGGTEGHVCPARHGRGVSLDNGFNGDTNAIGFKGLCEFTVP